MQSLESMESLDHMNMCHLMDLVGSEVNPVPKYTLLNQHYFAK